MVDKKQGFRGVSYFLSCVGMAAGISLCVAPANAEVTLENGVEAHEKIDALYDKLSEAVAALDSGPFDKIYAGEGYYLVPKAPMIKGIDGIRADWDKWLSWMKDGNGSLKIDFRIIAREVHDDKIGYDVGYATTLQKRPNEPDEIYESKIFLITKKQANGEWRFEVDSYSFLK